MTKYQNGCWEGGSVLRRSTASTEGWVWIPNILLCSSQSSITVASGTTMASSEPQWPPREPQWPLLAYVSTCIQVHTQRHKNSHNQKYSCFKKYTSFKTYFFTQLRYTYNCDLQKVIMPSVKQHIMLSIFNHNYTYWLRINFLNVDL